MNNHHTPENRPGASSWSQVLWAVALAIVGFGFAIYRYLQFSEAASGIRLSRLERPLYRLAGKWGLITVFILMGLMGVYYAVKYFRTLRK